MDLSKGVKKLTNRKRATPVSQERKIVNPEILPSDLQTPIFGADPDLQKEFSAISADDTYGIPVTAKEKDIISSKSLLSRRKLPVLDIDDISYALMSHEQLEKIAIFEVENKQDSGIYSVNDPRGGVVDRNAVCATCHRDNLECPGHLGMIRLHEHIIHPIVRKELLNVLTSVCGSCGGLLLPYETIKDKKISNLTDSLRLKELAKASEKIPCRRNVAEDEKDVKFCVPNPIYKLDNGKIYYTRDEKSKSLNLIPISEIGNILDSITEEDAEILGFHNKSHPRQFIMKSLAVIPLCARAPVIQEGEMWNDDLTVIYQDIVRINLDLENPNLKEAEREKLIDSLIFSIDHMINNADQKYRQLKKKPYQSIQERIQGKEALIRNALMGKRVNYSARTVIGPDPTLKFGQIRIPRVMAQYLTQHEIVSPENIQKMKYLLMNGKITHLIPSGGRMEGRRLAVTEKIRNEHTLVIGDEVDRWLENGDYVVYNRQPTLHKQGIMGYEVVLRDTLTIGLHLGYTKQHNAD